LKRTIVQSARYLDDIQSLADYGQERFGQRLTLKLLREIKAMEEMLQMFPFAGRLFADDVRRMLLGAYWLYYRVEPHQVVFLRIVRAERSVVDL
jgi:plasmid stabilization system protein ParE